MKQNFLGPIIKLSGAGNTFAVIDGRANSQWEIFKNKINISASEIAKIICDPIMGLATDGFLIVQDGSPGFDFDWSFFNSDGSTAEMCGNAARCAAYFCKEYQLANDATTIKFKTGAGLVTAELLSESEIEIKMPPAQILEAQKSLYTNALGEQTFLYTNTGVPHLVQKISSRFDYLELKEMARESRHHSELLPAGANVTFFSEIGFGKIKAVTFERGVEDFTPACGTGAVAAALAYYTENSQSEEVSVEMPGGKLRVQFDLGIKSPRLIGNAILIGEFRINLEVLTWKNSKGLLQP